MPETDTGIQDNPAATLDPTAEGDHQAPVDTENANDDTIPQQFLTADGQPDAQRLFKSYREIQVRSTKAEQEREKLRLEAERERGRREAIEEMAQKDAQNATGEVAPSAEAVAEARQKVIDRLGSDESAIATFELAQDQTQVSFRYTDQQVAAVLDEVKKTRAEMAEMRENADPFVQSNNPQINRIMQEAGISRQQAIKTLRTIHGQQSTTPPSFAATPPTQTGPGRPSPGQQARPQDDYTYTPEEQERARRAGIPESQWPQRRK